MIRYILKRLLILIPIILAISFIVFAIMSFSPGDPVRMMLGTNADPADAEALREQLGLNDPFLVQYFNYIKNAVLHLDFGTSYTTKQPVFNDIIGRFPTTVTLTVGGIIIAVVVSLPIGIISAIKQYSLMDNITVFMSMAFTAIPNVWLGLMLMLLFSYTLGWLPSSGIDSPLGYILPMI
ncbi:MAG: ABC transporter permease, partial [Lachnospiraceae bacterium]|nr:ABC transporter permease [Lachnospiraceae bacterium]